MSAKRCSKDPQNDISLESHHIGVPIVDFSDVHDKVSAGIKDRIASGRRRIGVKIGQKLSKDKMLSNDFDKRFAAVLELKLQIVKVRGAMKSLMDITRTLSQKTLELSNICGEVDIRDQDFVTTQLRLDEAMRVALDDSIGRALDSLDAKLEPFKHLNEKVKIRNNLKLEHEHYVRKVQDLQAKAGVDPTKLSNNKKKMAVSRELLHRATVPLYKAFNYYDAVGGRIVTPEIEIFKGAQVAFYRAALNIVQNLPLSDPIQIASDIHQLGVDSMYKTIVTGYEGQNDQLQPPPTTTTQQESTIYSSQALSTSTPWRPNTGGTEASKRGAWWEQSGKINEPPQVQVKVLFEYAAHDHTEISLEVGEIIKVAEKDESGWWLGEKGGVRGLFPANYVEII